MRNKVMKPALVATCVMSMVAVLATPLAAQSKKLSDRSVKVLMEYAWSLVPAKFTTPTGKIIITDKENRKAAMVPLAVARETIGAGRLSAYAQICNLPEEQDANFQTYMRLEALKKKWSDQQMLFINQLHLFTVMWLSGNAKLVSTGKDEPVKVEQPEKQKKISCSDKQRQKVKQDILQYLASNPVPVKKQAVKTPAKSVNN